MHIKQLGPYRIGKKLGRGGMGSVYEAWDDEANLRLAVKVLSPQLAMEEGFRERFEAEINSLKKLRHASIVRLYGYGEQEGILYYSMDLIDGTSLEEEIKSGRRFTWVETIDIGVQICRALKHAHDHGVVHRDIKPANLLLSANGQIKIADFGIARLFGGSQLTTAGGVLGTADYMSPEQADGRQVTEKCDQYSLGGVLYALLAGQPPFRASTLPEMLQLQRFAEPALVRQYAPETPEQLESLISQLLSKDPQDRFPNAMVLGRHMEAMVKALSRTKSSDSELSQPHLEERELSREVSDLPFAKSLPSATLPAEGNVMLPTGIKEVSTQLFEAPTLAEPEADSQVSQVEETPIATDISTNPPGSSRFTTVDHEESRLQMHPTTSRLSMVFQLGVIIVALALLVWCGWWLMRPATADDLYVKIMGLIDEKGTENLRVIEGPLLEFFEKFPQDHRTQELDKYREGLELQQMERKLKRNSSLGDNRQLSPIGQLYSKAVSVAATDPESGLEMLGSLLDLYAPGGIDDPTWKESDFAQIEEPIHEGNDSPSRGDASNLPVHHAQTAPKLKRALNQAPINEEDRRWLILANRQYSQLKIRVEKLRKNSVSSLNKRLELAIQLKPTHPQTATPMFQAIINLYSHQPWAREIVEQARNHLESEVQPVGKLK